MLPARFVCGLALLYYGLDRYWSKVAKVVDVNCLAGKLPHGSIVLVGGAVCEGPAHTGLTMVGCKSELKADRGESGTDGLTIK